MTAIPVLLWRNKSLSRTLDKTTLHCIVPIILPVILGISVPTSKPRAKTLLKPFMNHILMLDATIEVVTPAKKNPTPAAPARIIKGLPNL